MRILLVFLFAGGILASQYAYDRAKIELPVNYAPPSPALIKTLDLGLHAAVASFLWIPTRIEILDPQRGPGPFLADLALVNAIDPKFSAPYAFATLALPFGTRYPNRVALAIDIGTRGVAQAEPDWRIPFYLATDYFIILKDNLHAAKYFDVAAQTPGVPDYIKRFSQNYSIANKVRENAEAAWLDIYNHAKDEGTRKRAKAYIVHLQIVDFLDHAVKLYKERYGIAPPTLNDLVRGHILTAIPEDPLGFGFAVSKEGEIAVRQD